MHKRSKLNYLMRIWKPGTAAVAPWLKSHGISKSLVDWYISAGWLVPLGRGVYQRPGDSVQWQGALYAIQHYLKKPIHLGARSALEILGRGHYGYLGNTPRIFCFGERGVVIPKWFSQNKYWNIELLYLRTNLFNKSTSELYQKEINGVPIIHSGPERAILELLYLVPHHQGLDEAYLIMQGLGNLRPNIVQILLENCQSIKVKRLFMTLAKMHNLSFLNKLNTSSIDFGKGKRVIGTGGVYHSKYQLSLPRIREEE